MPELQLVNETLITDAADIEGIPENVVCVFAGPWDI
jgi:hypothetical protein